MSQKRCLTIQDYSCLGRCSLTVALPTISAFGVETVGLPTAILSNHTAGFKNWTYVDLTSYMLDIVDHWKEYDHNFDAIYTGYLASEQVDIVLKIFNKLKETNTKIIVDPAFGDNGTLYKAFDLSHVEEIKKLIKEADITMPNLTEACFLTGTEYKKDYDENYIQELIYKLSLLGPKQICISGISFKEGIVGCYIYENNKFSYYSTPSYPGKYHGTGDIFASSVVGGILSNLTFYDACSLAHDLVHLSIYYSIKDKRTDLTQGVEFEKALSLIPQRIEHK